ncbi:MAG: 3-isopropylmalate dehydrogenase [Anaeromicrobium sp.]|uniref:3-isopropylmalate dehydrogenase n=1 Tax=Anaeromicrobium sp. TaxID=1929132 RepID=UPI0025CE24EB|nr:3-isopropylmalate dehydrogenase [Anaeromicrobium sp.]MCT4594631.1 3-isopropylmalate dehydrogenase [Anaeromicrobium sp.]
MDFNISVIYGDGIGPEIIDSGIRVLNKIEKVYGHKFNMERVLLGGEAIDECKNPIPDETIDKCRKSDAVLLGAVGGPKWDHLKGNERPEAGLLALRKSLGVYANIRPAILFEELKESSPLKSSLIKENINICIVRELTGGIYFGEKGKEENEAYDVERYNREEIRRIAKTAFHMAMKRNKKVTSIDKANVLESSKLWRQVVEEVAKDYKEVELEHMYIDNGAMQLIRQPANFDVVLTNNIFGDILSDEASAIVGSIGVLPSASLGEGVGLYEPIHGSAPDIAGENKANPIGTILSICMMMKNSLGLYKEGTRIEEAVKAVLKKGYRTSDIMSDNKKLVGTREMTELIIEEIK